MSIGIGHSNFAHQQLAFGRGYETRKPELKSGESLENPVWRGGLYCLGSGPLEGGRPDLPGIS
jgi:hypothetical protein